MCTRQQFSRLPLLQYFLVLPLPHPYFPWDQRPTAWSSYLTITCLLPDFITYLATWAFCSGKNFMYVLREGPGAVILRAGIGCKESRYLLVGTFYCVWKGAVRVRERLGNRKVLQQCHDHIRTMEQYTVQFSNKNFCKYTFTKLPKSWKMRNLNLTNFYYVICLYVCTKILLGCLNDIWWLLLKRCSYSYLSNRCRV